MRVIRDTTQIRLEIPSVVLIGKFDGFHRGHQRLLREAIAARGPGRQVVMFTFSRPPQNLLSGRQAAGLTTTEERREMAERCGVDVLVEYPFTEEVRHMPAREFLTRILLEELRAEVIVAGPDCAFGYQRQGNIAFLREHSREGAFSLVVVEKELYGGSPISSTRIREALLRGAVEEAGAMLGYSYRFRSAILHGRQLGRTLGFPTINQMISPEKVCPAFGVYASRVWLEGKEWLGISNVGVKPTVSGGNAAGVETYIYNFDQMVYGKTVQVELEHFLRPERKFESLEALRRQVESDRQQVQRYWRDRVEKERIG